MLLQLFSTLAPTFAIQDPTERLAARKALTAADGALTKHLAAIDSLIAAVSTAFYCGDEPTVADFILYVNASNGRSGYAFMRLLCS